MDNARRLRELGLSVGRLPPGPTNTIVDVPGVRVGHCDVRGRPPAPGTPPVCTGVTVVVPGTGNLLRSPLPAAVDVFNGHTKSAGVAQLLELGRLESPIYLTTTLCVGRVWDAAVSIALDQSPEAVSVCPAVFECNDFRLNDVRGRHVGAEHVRRAYASAGADPPAMGSVGAGSGTRCMGRNGGIGSGSRVVETKRFARSTVGVLSLSNFGGTPRWRGRELPPPGGRGEREPAAAGSVIVVVATDAPLGPNLLRRLARRTWAGIARVGSSFGQGSGDVAVAFSLPGPDGPCPDALPWAAAHDDLDPLLTAVADATEESVWDCMLLAGDATADDGTPVPALRPEELAAGDDSEGST